MSTTVTFAGVTYQIPTNNERNWGTSLTSFLVSIANNAMNSTNLLLSKRTVSDSSFTVFKTDSIVELTSTSDVTIALETPSSNKIFILVDSHTARRNIVITDLTTIDSYKSTVVLGYHDSSWQVLFNIPFTSTDSVIALEAFETSLSDAYCVVQRDESGDVKAVQSTKAVKLPSGTSAQRPTGILSMFRYNTELNYPEFFNGSEWKQLNTTDEAGLALNDLTDIAITTPSEDQVLSYNGSNWVNATAVTTLEALTDTDITSPSENQVLAYDGSDWVNTTIDTAFLSSTLNASESISEGDVVKLDTSNTVSKANVTLSSTAPTPIAIAETAEYMSACQISNNKIAICYRGSDDNGYVMIATYEDNTITFNEPIEFSSTAITRTSIVKLSEDRFAIAFVRNGSGSVPSVVACQAVGTYVLMGDISYFTTAGSNHVDIIAFSSNKVLAFYNDGDNSYRGYLCSAGIYGLDIITDTPVIISTDDNTSYCKLVKLTSSKAMAAWSANALAFTRAAVVNMPSFTPTFGAITNIFTNNADIIAAHRVDDTHAIFATYNGANAVLVATVVDGSDNISKGTVKSINFSKFYYPTFAQTDTDKFVLYGRDTVLQSYYFSVDNVAITDIMTYANTSGVVPSWTTAIPVQDNKHLLLFSHNSTNVMSAHTTYISGNTVYHSASMPDLDRVLGISLTTTTSGNPVQVLTQGEYTTTSLTAGSKYYLADDGTLSDEIGLQEKLMGLAISTTKLIVR